jgi:integrase
MPRSGFQRLRNGKWRYQYRHPVTGKRGSITASTREEVAERARRLGALRTDLQYGADPRSVDQMLRPALGKTLRVSDVWARYLLSLTRRARAKAQGIFRQHLAELGPLLVWELDETCMGAWRARLASTGGRAGTGRAPKTIRLAYDLLSSAVRKSGLAAERLPWGTWRPPSARQPQKPRECVRSIEELAAILLAARDHDTTELRRGRYSAAAVAAAVLAFTGLRNAEAAGLGWDQVRATTEPAILRVVYQAPKGWPRSDPGPRPLVPPKGGKPRVQLLHPTAVAALQSQQARLTALGWYAPDGPVFPKTGGGWRTDGQALRPALLRRLVVAAGLPSPDSWTTHSLRHSFASLELLASGGDLRATQERTGHSSLEQLQGYLHQLGRGTPASRVPCLAPELFAPALPTAGAPVPARPALPPAAAPAPLSDVFTATTDAGKAFERAGSGRRSRAPRAFADLAADWVGAGEPGHEPDELAPLLERYYHRAYSAARRREQDAKAAGKRALRGARAAWARALKAARARAGIPRA